MKGIVAKKYFIGRTQAQTVNQLRDAFRNKSLDNHKPLDCASLIRHCEEYMLLVASEDKNLQVLPASSSATHEDRMRAILYVDPSVVEVPQGVVEILQQAQEDAAAEELYVEDLGGSGSEEES